MQISKDAIREHLLSFEIRNQKTARDIVSKRYAEKLNKKKQSYPCLSTYYHQFCQLSASEIESTLRENRIKIETMHQQTSGE